MQRLDKAKEAIDEADYVIIGAGAGLSTAAGIDYGGERHKRYFKDFIEKYGFTDMYTSSFYRFETPEEQWAYWARHIFANRYDVGKTDVYTIRRCEAHERSEDHQSHAGQDHDG